MWRFHKDMREKDQGGNINPTSGGKTDILETENQSSNNDAVDSYSLQVDPRSSLSATTSTGENISKASSPGSKSEAGIDPPDYVSNSPLELSAANTKNTKNLEKEKALN